MEARAEAAVTDYIPSPEIVSAIRDWLGEDGLSFFRQNLAEHGTVSPVLSLKYGDGFIPYAVHFRDGMQVRNKLRDLTNNLWTAHEYDERWTTVVEKAILPTV